MIFSPKGKLKIGFLSTLKGSVTCSILERIDDMFIDFPTIVTVLL